MGWSCETCTFLNAKDDSKTCEICETVRLVAIDLTETNGQNFDANANAKKRPLEQKSVQSTLFGGVAQPPPTKKSAPKKSKPSSLTDAREAKQSTFSSSMLTTDNSTVTIWKTTASRDIPLTELKDRAQTAMKQIFGVEKLRFLQPKAVTCALKRKSQIVVMATGGGAFEFSAFCMKACIFSIVTDIARFNQGNHYVTSFQLWSWVARQSLYRH
jgi:hypothetical protein